MDVHDCEEVDDDCDDMDIEQRLNRSANNSNRRAGDNNSAITNKSNQQLNEISNEAKLMEDWEVISTEREYIPKATDVGCRLCIEVTAISSVSENTEATTLLAGPVRVYTEAVLARPTGPPKRSFAAIAGAGSGLSGSIRFRVISYNILAEMLATKQCYPQCDSWILSWPYRKKLIFLELMEVQADICCLQEVQADLYDNDILPMMNALGYDGIFKSKSRDFIGSFGKVRTK